jgi:hypothetical protein
MYFFDVHGNLHITIRPDLTKSLGWATPKYDNDGNPIPNTNDGGPVESESVCLDINYSGEVGDLNSDCDIVIKKKSKALRENND